MDWLNYVMACVVIFMEAWSRHLLHESTADLNGATAELSSNGTASTSGGFDAPSFYGLYVCFYRAARMSAMAYTFMGVNAVVTWLKLLKYLNLFPHLSMLSITLRNAAYPAISFSVMFAIVFCSCGQAFNLAFGAQLRDFSTFSRSMMSLFRALLGDFDYTSIEEADRVVGPILFTVFIFLVVFVLLNMFIAILTEAYEKAKVEVFGDAVHEREENWVGAMSFLDYTKRALGWTIRAIIPGLSTNVYEQKEGDGAPRCEPKVPFVGANPSRKPDKPSLTRIERAMPTAACGVWCSCPCRTEGLRVLGGAAFRVVPELAGDEVQRVEGEVGGGGRDRGGGGGGAAQGERLADGARGQAAAALRRRGKGRAAGGGLLRPAGAHPLIFSIALVPPCVCPHRSRAACLGVRAVRRHCPFWAIRSSSRWMSDSARRREEYARPTDAVTAAPSPGWHADDCVGSGVRGW